MADVVSPSTRSRMMSGIRARDTKPEMLIRRGLHSRGYRYHLHYGKLPGKPDLVFPSRRAVIFVHGCFWHGHCCTLFKWPSTRAEWWRAKIQATRERDDAVRERLAELGWRQFRVWECAVKGKGRLDTSVVLDRASAWLDGASRDADVRGL